MYHTSKPAPVKERETVIDRTVNRHSQKFVITSSFPGGRDVPGFMVYVHVSV